MWWAISLACLRLGAIAAALLVLPIVLRTSVVVKSVMWIAVPPPPPPPVVVQAYTEALCIDCKHFIDQHLVATYHTLGPKVVDLQIVPFGNSKLLLDKQQVECQHGNGECDANSWEQCAIQAYQPPTYLTFIGCLETSLPMGMHNEPYDEGIFHDCADLAFMDFNDLKACHDNPLLKWQLQQQFAKMTPEHDHVPWVLINGEYMDEENYDLMEEVCKEYQSQGGAHPACPSTTSTGAELE
jgi:interferon gamma-inducible protein 30